MKSEFNEYLVDLQCAGLIEIQKGNIKLTRSFTDSLIKELKQSEGELSKDLVRESVLKIILDAFDRELEETILKNYLIIMQSGMLILARKRKLKFLTGMLQW